jgi:antitoxin component of MazEF toxin-antitoxin module
MKPELAQFAAKVQKDGDSIVIVVPQSALDRLNVKEGDEVVVSMMKYLNIIHPRKR